jgi:hypothetical protein
MKREQFEHDGMNSRSEVERGRQEEIRSFDTHAPLAASEPDPRRVQLLALFDMSDERGKVTLLAIAGIHAARFPKGK